VVCPLRDVRRRMKAGFPGMNAAAVESLRAQVKRIELESERQQQDFLYAIAKNINDKKDLSVLAAARADRNIRRYFAEIGVSPEPADESDCETVLTGCFGAGPAAAD